ncbi:hypothetical protein DAEQUDRAFT_747814 [Daedalea quercina L-15889]|uniref:Aminopeptidase n=1 Tax=Daedalea quercina L-15889 TaxID=1314783 RepID=A0A165KRZ0_9APHY|nr:hypothetical protein DAEQUDRAFT_747814 [Daedalea quercina L-15889]
MTTIPTSTETSYWLPTHARLTHYDIVIHTNLLEGKFNGIVVINLDVMEDTSKLVFNSVNLKLSNITLTTKSLNSTPTSIACNKTVERCALCFMEVIPSGVKAQLKIVYQGELTDSLMGYYKSIGVEDENEIYALTQFKPTAARHAFPCWDEPMTKATFSVTMVSHADTVNLSNMPAESEYMINAPVGKTGQMDSTVFEGKTLWKITQFEKSPPMSTYLVTFANGQFEYLESSYTTTKDMIKDTQFMLGVKMQAIPLYKEVFDIEYPLPELDMLVAHDFNSGAMENWGLITGSTSCFAMDPISEDLGTKRISQLQFGNITMMEWWDNLYLNEGEVNLIFPMWRLHIAFLTTNHKQALDINANLSSHPVEVDCPDTDMVNQIFDDLSYSKAASVLHMLLTYVSEEKFLKGMSLYLNKHLYTSSVTSDLWEGIQEASGIDVPRMMDDWVKKIGFPVLTVTKNTNSIHICQDCFLGTGPPKLEDNKMIWTVPLSLLMVNEQGDVVIDRDEVLDGCKKTILLNVTKLWKLNAGTVTFYRVLYPPEQLVKIGMEAARATSPFSVEDCIGLIDDAFSLSKAGYSDVSSALALMEVLHNELEYFLWQNIQDNLKLLHSVWSVYEDIVNSIQDFIVELFTPIVDKLGYEYSSQDSADTRELWTLAIEGAAFGRSPKVIEELQGHFTHHMSTGDESKIPSELEHIIYATMNGGRTEWDAMKEIAIKSKDPSTGTVACKGLTAMHDPEIARDTWTYMMEEVRMQDLYDMSEAMGDNPQMRQVDYELVVKKFKGNYMSFQDIVEASFCNLSPYEDYEEAVEFFKEKDTGKYEMVLKQTLEGIQTQSAWAKQSTEDIRKWFASRRIADSP